MSNADWSAALDAFEARLQDQAQALAAGGDPIIDVFVPPQLEAPFPEHLLERAQVLVQRCRDIEADLVHALGDVSAALARTAAAPASGDQQPVYFDSRV